MDEEKKNKAKIGERISLFFRKKFLMDKTITFLLIAILVVGYISVNLWVRELDLKEIDVTKNKIYTLSDASRQAVSKIDQDIKIYAYGYEPNSTFINFLKQYHEANEKITYELLTEENNAALIQQYGLTNSYVVVILESGDSKKVIDASTEFSTYDYTTYDTVDITEQVMTNSILSLTEENKPNVYFTEGHNEISIGEMGVLTTYLKNEAFQTNSVNILTEGKVPDDCNILAIMSPASDFLEPEIEAIQNYINKGGKLYFTVDTIFTEQQNFPNLSKLLDEFGVSVKNGYVVEQDSNKTISGNYPYIFVPEASSENDITYDIYAAKSNILFMFASKLEFKDDDTLSTLGVTKETLLSTTENSLFITDVKATDLETALKTAETGSAELSALLTKTVKTTSETGEEEENEAQLIIVTCGKFIADYAPEQLGSSSMLSTVGSNKDFVINGLSYLGKKENILTIRKDLDGTSYAFTSTEQQTYIVLAIIFIVPIAIIIFGIIVWSLRKKRK